MNRRAAVRNIVIISAGASIIPSCTSSTNESSLHLKHVPVTASQENMLAELTETQLVSILTDTKNALTRQYAKLLAMEGVELEFSQDALTELAGQAIRKGTGARALRSLLEKLMLDVMYDVPSSDDILHILITRAVVAGESKPVIRRRQGRAAA